AVGRGRVRQRGEELLRRREGVGVEIRRAQQALERLAYGLVVIDDGDAGACFHHGIWSITDCRQRRYWTLGLRSRDVVRPTPHAGAFSQLVVPAAPPAGDRKSTRLNSSH